VADRIGRLQQSAAFGREIDREQQFLLHRKATLRVDGVVGAKRS
jgi:hypothetical protein